MYGTSMSPEEEQNTSQTSPTNPSPGEGGVLVGWNPFDVEESEQTQTQTLTASERDSTRFKKAYSFTRQQPVKVRVYRK
jgi:hypothetical protein